MSLREKRRGKNVYFANVNDQSQRFPVERSLTVLIKHVKTHRHEIAILPNKTNGIIMYFFYHL